VTWRWSVVRTGPTLTPVGCDYLVQLGRLVFVMLLTFILIIIIILAHQHKACRQLKIKQEMTAVGD